MLKMFVEEAAALTSVVLFVGHDGGLGPGDPAALSASCALIGSGEKPHRCGCAREAGVDRDGSEAAPSADESAQQRRDP